MSFTILSAPACIQHLSSLILKCFSYTFNPDIAQFIGIFPVMEKLSISGDIGMQNIDYVSLFQNRLKTYFWGAQLFVNAASNPQRVSLILLYSSLCLFFASELLFLIA